MLNGTHPARRWAFRLALPGAGVNGLKLAAFTARLEQHVDFVAAGGTSAGALEAAGIAVGLTGQERVALWERVLAQGPKLVDGGVHRLLFGARGWAAGRAIERELDRVFGGRRMADVHIPLRVVAGDLCNGCAVVFCSRAHPELLIKDVVRAAAAVEVLFEPVQVRHDNARVYGDAGPALNVPAGLWDDYPEEDDVPTLAVRLEGHTPTKRVQDLIQAASSSHVEEDMKRVRTLGGVVEATFNLFMDAAAMALPSQKLNTWSATVRGRDASFNFNLDAEERARRIALGTASADEFLTRLRRR